VQQARCDSLSPFGERVGVRGLPSLFVIETSKPLTPSLSHRTSGLPEFGTFKRPKSDISDLGWERERAASVATL
jgi:hypothetical protein